MQDAGKLLSAAWVAQTDKEAKLWKTWGKAKQKKWSQDDLALSLKAFGLVLDNAKETLTKINVVRDAMKTALDGTEKIIAVKRQKSEPLSDAERAWIGKAKATIDGSAKVVDALTKTFSDNSPFAGRGDYHKGPLADGAIGADFPAKIMAARTAGIDPGNEFGESGPVTLRRDEYLKRWDVLMKELDALEKQRSGTAQEWAAAVNNQLEDFQASNEKQAFDLDTTISKVQRNVTNILGKVDASTPKGFGAALVKAVKLKVSAKAKGKADDDLKALHVCLKGAADTLKQAKGSLKTRTSEFQSLTAQLKDAGPHAEPQRKTLAALGAKLGEYQTTIDGLVVQVDEATAAAKT